MTKQNSDQRHSYSQNLAESDYFHEDLDQYAAEYNDQLPQYWADLIYKDCMINRIVPRLIGPRVLEMGAGIGDWTRALIEVHGYAHVVEGSSKLCEAARETFGSDVTVTCSLFEDYEPEKLFDSIVCSMVLEHVLNPVEVLKRSRSWLKPGGQMFVCVPHADSLHRRLGVIMGLNQKTHDLAPSDYAVGHRRVYHAQELEADIKAAGFQSLSNVSMGLKVVHGAAMTHLSHAQISGMFDLGDQIPLNMRCILAYFCEN